MVTRGWFASPRAIAAAIVLLVSTIAIAAPPIPVANRKFDHDRHVTAASAGGKRADCADCHRYDGNGTMKPGKEHTRCASCHTYPSSCSILKTPGPKGPARVCEVCHVAKRRDCLPNDLPPPPRTASFAAKFTHGKHLTLGTSIEKDCMQCHQAQAPTGVSKTPAHKLCSGCHNANGVKPPMTECASCHATPVAKTAAAPDPFRLTNFDHKAHHNTSRQASCVGCHDKLVGTGDAAVPRPSMLGCQTRCHDGQKAFSAVGTKCTQCHQGTGTAQPTRPDAAFLHTAHAGRNVKITECATCHGVEADGRLTPPLAQKDHMPCAMSGCHQTEFASRSTKICGICHDQVAPWQKTVSRSRPSPGKPEWYESMNHASHLEKTGTANGACTSCHGEKLTGGKKPGSHDGCVGCHGKGTAFAMNQCGGCHLKDAPARATPNQWSVAAAFDKVGGHQKHAVDPRSKRPAACLDCHANVRTAKSLATLKPASMNDCDGACHNGKVAFKTTGFECSRCHTAPKGTTPTAMTRLPSAVLAARSEPGQPASGQLP